MGIQIDIGDIVFIRLHHRKDFEQLPDVLVIEIRPVLNHGLHVVVAPSEELLHHVQVVADGIGRFVFYIPAEKERAGLGGAVKNAGILAAPDVCAGHGDRQPGLRRPFDIRPRRRAVKIKLKRVRISAGQSVIEHMGIAAAAKLQRVLRFQLDDDVLCRGIVMLFISVHVQKGGFGMRDALLTALLVFDIQREVWAALRADGRQIGLLEQRGAFGALQIAFILRACAQGQQTHHHHETEHQRKPSFHPIRPPQYNGLRRRMQPCTFCLIITSGPPFRNEQPQMRRRFAVGMVHRSREKCSRRKALSGKVAGDTKRP